MSIYKNLIIDSSNRTSGDSSDFTIDIDRNFFTKPPNSIKLIDSKIPIDVVFLNETNNCGKLVERS